MYQVNVKKCLKDSKKTRPTHLFRNPGNGHSHQDLPRLGELNSRQIPTELLKDMNDASMLLASQINLSPSRGIS
jgi:hypothetical protein|tara:strand:- start:6695 stop:6916 length:222 start_codon:yes stop_codon:yes gene_type:complete